MATTTVSSASLASAAGAASGTTPALLTTSTVSLPDTCTNTRQVNPEPDGAGGFAPSDPVTLGPWACRMLKEPKPLDKTLAGGVVTTVAARELEVELGANIRIGDALQHAGREYAVLDSDAGTTGATFVTVYLEWLGHLSAS